MQSHRDGLEVAAGETAVGREALGQDQAVAGRRGQFVVVQREPAADVRERVLLRAHRHAVGDREHVAHDVRHGPVTLARLAALDEPGVLGEAAAIDVERLTVPAGDLSGRAHVLEADRLPAARVVRHGQHHERYPRTLLLQQPVEALEVDVALERMRLVRVVRRGGHQVHRLGAGRLDVAAGRVEVRVGRYQLALAADDREQDRLGRPSLVGRDDVTERHQLAHSRLEPVVGRGAGIGLVAPHHGRPLLRAHRAGAGIGQQVDDHVVGVDREQVPARFLEQRPPLGGRREPDRLHHLDPERLDDRLHARFSW